MLRKLWALFPFARYEVAGQSMTPALSPRERVFVNKAAYWWRSPRRGDLVVLRDPRQPDRLLVKRIDRASESGAWLVRGDNPQASTDSREFGSVPRDLIVGKVWFRY